MRTHLFKKNSAGTFEQGMTFLELIVVLGIFAAISSTVLFNYHDFSANVALQNLAQDIALQIKQAQTDAVSGRIPVFSAGSDQFLNTATLTPPDRTPSYGIAFNTHDYPATFFYYFNKSGDPERDFADFANYTGCGASDTSGLECLQEIKITSGDIIDMICFNFDDTLLNSNSSSGTSCSADFGGQEPGSNKASIAFKRPRNNAAIMELDDGTTGPDKSNVFIRLTSPSGGHKYISVWESGYISIR